MLSMIKRRVKGVVIGSRWVELEEPLPIPEGTPVEVTISQSEAPGSRRQARGSLEAMLATLDIIQANLRMAHFLSPEREEVDARIREERDS